MGEEPKQILRLFSSLNQTTWTVGLWGEWGPIMVHVFSEKIVCFWSGDVAGGTLHSNSEGKAGFLSCNCQVFAKMIYRHGNEKVMAHGTAILSNFDCLSERGLHI
jgi:hypothetical protein